MDDVGFMQMALAQAELGRGTTSPNPMVGAVVVQGGRVVGRGYHRVAGGRHAEVAAIDDAGDAAAGATLYVTLEPCNHFGRTPPCTEKILAAGIRRVVAAMRDPNPHVAGGGLAVLAQKGLQVEAGVCEAQARRQNECFVKFIRTGSPFVIAKCAATLDGRIATRSGDAKWVTGESARAYVHRLRHWVDAIMVGGGTVRRDDPGLTTRLPGGSGRDPVRIVLDSNLRLSPDAKVMRQRSAAPTWVVSGSEAAASQGGRFEKAGVRVVAAPLRDGRIDLKRLMEELGRLGITSLLIEGGSQVMGSAVRDGIIDKVLFFFAPKITGGDDGFPICGGAGAVRMADCVRLSGIQVHRFDEDVAIEGYIVKPGMGD